MKKFMEKRWLVASSAKSENIPLQEKQESFRAPKRDGEIRFFFIWDDPENDPEKNRSLKRIKTKIAKILFYKDFGS